MEIQGNQISCGTCKFWDKSCDDPAWGPCRRHAPLASSMDPLSQSAHPDACWPRTKADDWCGEWDQKVETHKVQT